jgi:hypothetical protein
VSYGGSSLLASFVIVGILLSISHRAAVGPSPVPTAGSQGEGAA